MFEGSLQGVSRMFQGSLKGVSRKFYGSFKQGLGGIRESFKGDSRELQGI